MEIVRQLAGRIMPAACLLCDIDIGAESALCPGCLADLPLAEDGCPVCGAPGVPGLACGDCQTRPPPFQHSIAALAYSTPVDSLIRAFKYRGNLPAVRALTPLLTRRIREECDVLPALMLPVPLHRRRLYQRGFNQSLVIARALRRELGLPIDTTLARRIRATREQARLAPPERRRNLKRAFALNHRPAADSVAIIDDVITTGTTVTELARLLRKAGVREIYVWALAKAQER